MLTVNSWDEFYSRERSNFSENPEDTGECWFSDSNAQSVMVRFLEDLATEQPDLLDTEESTFIDLGTGNGQLLLGVRAAGFEGQLTGIDYSEPAVEFASKVVEKECEDDEDDDFENYQFLHADFLVSNEWNKENQTWDVVLDKGTLDAIALADVKYGSKTGVQIYSSRALELMKAEGILLITSCNFTEEELIKIIENDGDLVVFDKVQYPTFQFGGVKGQTVCTVAFKRK